VRHHPLSQALLRQHLQAVLLLLLQLLRQQV
jgi:hypothetical protein